MELRLRKCFLQVAELGLRLKIKLHVPTSGNRHIIYSYFKHDDVADIIIEGSITLLIILLEINIAVPLLFVLELWKIQ